MSDNFNLSETIDTLFAKLESFIKTKTVVGEPMQIGEVTIIPFIDISFGLGTGGGSGGGAGSGGRVSPTAILVLKGDQVELLPIKKAGGLEKLIDMVPEIIDKARDHKCCE